MSSTEATPIRAPEGKILSSGLTAFEERQEVEAKLRAMIGRSRSGEVKLPTAATTGDLNSILQNLAGRNVGPGDLTLPTNWRREFMFALYSQSSLPVNRICDVVGISYAMLQKHRRRDRQLDTAVRDYQSGFYEREAQEPTGGLHPALIIYGVKSRAGWTESEKEGISPTRLRTLIEGIALVIDREVDDEALKQRIGLGIQELLENTEAHADLG